jgi:Zn finger protein HypA/HybF involved in hydrogenase expression
VSLVESLNRTLEQELNALLRGVSLECLVCGEFVMRRGSTIFCPECGSEFAQSGARLQSGSGAQSQAAGSRLQLSSQAG